MLSPSGSLRLLPEMLSSQPIHGSHNALLEPNLWRPAGFRLQPGRAQNISGYIKATVHRVFDRDWKTTMFFQSIDNVEHRMAFTTGDIKDRERRYTGQAEYRGQSST